MCTAIITKLPQQVLVTLSHITGWSNIPMQWCSAKFGTGGMLRSALLLPSPLFSSLLFPALPSSLNPPCPSTPFLTFPPILPPLPSLGSRPFNLAWGSGRVGKVGKLSQHSLRWSPSWNQIWRILALIYDIWWKHFQQFAWEPTYQISCSITVPSCTDIIWDNGVPPKISGDNEPAYQISAQSCNAQLSYWQFHQLQELWPEKGKAPCARWFANL